MPDFKAPNAPNSISAPTGGAYSAPPDPLAGFKEPTSKGREGREEKGEEGMREGGGMGGKEGAVIDRNENFLFQALLYLTNGYR